jgi:5-formyltetrahydrofolate cyclo-ligase
MARTTFQGKIPKKTVTNIVAEKKQLREHVRASLHAMSGQERTRQSAMLCELLSNHPIFRQSNSILFYAPLPDEEVDVWPLLEKSLPSGKEIYLPRFDADTKRYDAARIVEAANDVVKGRFEIREPAAHCARNPLKRLDLILVPGIAFSRNGSRLGRGRGFYDRLLSELRGKTCGIGFQCQLVDLIPLEQHDVVLDHILTPTLWHTVR